MKKRMSLYTWMIVGNFIFPFMNVFFFYYDRGIRIWMVSGNCGLEYG